jgi:hypothetical protein
MLTLVNLKNFRGFHNLELNLKPISVVMGPNSSGKTSVLHAISLAHRAYSMVLDDPNTYPTLGARSEIHVCNGLILRDHTQLLPIAERNEIFRDAIVSEGVTSTISLAFSDGDPVRRLDVSLAYMRNAVLKMSVTVDCPDAASAVKPLAKKSKYRPQRLLETLRRDRPFAVLIPAFYGVTIGEEFRSAPVVDELLQSGQQSSIVRNLVSRLEAADLEQLNAFLMKTIGARIEERTPSQDSERVSPLVVRFSDTNGRLDLSAAGAGLVNLVALFSALKFRQRAGKGTTVFLFDEPEAHLHPRLQGVLGDELATTVRSFSNAQLIAATHSIEMINHLGRRDDTVLFAVDRGSGTSAALESESQIVDELGRWADLSPFTSLNFLASRKLLFHEGPSDARILVRSADALFRNRPERLAALRRWTLVPLGGTGNIPAMEALKKVIQPKIFPGLEKGDAVSLVLVLDRDRIREPGMTSKKQGQLDSKEIVWSRHSIESLFLEPSILSQWLSATLPVGLTPEATLQGYIAEAIAVVDEDQALIDEAASDMMVALLRGGARPTDAMQQSLDKVRTAPATWQKGRERARRIMEEVRNRLSHAERRWIRSSIAEQLAEAKVERLGSPESAIPEEVRRLLDAMTSS